MPSIVSISYSCDLSPFSANALVAKLKKEKGGKKKRKGGKEKAQDIDSSRLAKKSKVSIPPQKLNKKKKEKKQNAKMSKPRRTKG